MDSINIKGLEVFAHHGVYREENVLGQKFVAAFRNFCGMSVMASPSKF